MRARVASLVDNPEVLARYGGAPQSRGEDYELLIVTTQALESSFAPLADYYAARGIRAVTHTMEDIRASESGVDDAEKVRQRIHG